MCNWVALAPLSDTISHHTTQRTQKINTNPLKLPKSRLIIFCLPHPLVHLGCDAFCGIWYGVCWWLQLLPHSSDGGGDSDGNHFKRKPRHIVSHYCQCTETGNRVSYFSVAVSFSLGLVSLVSLVQKCVKLHSCLSASSVLGYIRTVAIQDKAEDKP